MIVRVYRYGLLAPTEHAELVREQIRDSNRLRNKHVEIERARRAKHRAALASYEELRSLEKDIADAKDAERAAWLVVAAARSERRNKQDTAPLASALKQAKAHVSDLMHRHHDLRALLRQDEAIRIAADAANEDASEARRNVRAEFSQRGQRMVPGTYMMIESAAEQAAKKPMYDGIEPSDPAFKPWRGEGRIGQQIHGGAVETIGSHWFMRIVPPAARQDAPDCAPCMRQHTNGSGYRCPPRSERTNGCRRCCPVVSGSHGRSQHAELWLAVRVDPKTHERTWAKFPMQMHRPLPPGSVITFAAVSLRKIGPREEWSTELTVRTPSSEVCRAEPGSVIAIDIGWRIIGDEIRAASWVASDGARGELRLSPRDVSSIRKADELRSVRKLAFNEALERLCVWLRERDMPEWMRARTAHRQFDEDGHEMPREVPSQAQALAYMSEWEAQGKLASLVRAWADNRFEGDAEIYGSMEAWRYHDYHLWCWESSQRTQSLRRRRDLYRCFAREMSDRYETLVLEDFDLRVFARRKPKESQETENDVARSNRQLVALSELRLCLSNRFTGLRGRKAPARDTTRRCNVCGVIETFNAAVERTHQCRNGHTWDQDANAAENLMTIWRERPGDCRPMGTARIEEKASEDTRMEEGRRTKTKRLAAERRARLDTARNSGDKAAE